MSEDEDEDEWIDVSHSSEESSEDDGNEDDDNVKPESNAVNISSDTKCDSVVSESRPSVKQQEPATTGTLSKAELAAQRKELAAAISTTRLLTDEDFKQIEVAQLKKEVTSAKNKRRGDSDINSK